MNLTDRARAGELDPLIGRTDELQRTMEILCRRRKNNPVFVGDAGVGKTALAEGLATRLLERRRAGSARRAPRSSRSTPARCSPARGSAATSRSGSRRSSTRSSKRPMPILFIDEIHSTVGAGATTGGTMDLATLIKPILTAGQLRVVGSTTHEEFKHIEKDRALARRLQKITIDEPSIQETVRILQGLRSRYEAHHRVRYTDEALEAAAKLAARHLRDYKLPDSAIDLIDEAGAKMRLKIGATRATARTTAAAEPVEIGAEHMEEVVARMARIPAKQASSSDKDRLKGLEESLGRVVFGQAEAVRTVARAIKRSRAGLGQPDRPGRLLPLHRSDRRRQDRARQAARAAPRQRVHALRHERVHGEARRRAADRRAARDTSASSRAACSSTRIRQHPYAVLLLDEIEKAHPDIFNILLQVMDHATLTDNNGRKADFRQVVLIMTSNAGSRELSNASIGFWEIGRVRARASTAGRRRRSSARSRRSRRSSARSSATGSTRSSPSIR